MRLASLVVYLAVSGCAYSAQSRAADWIVVDTQHVRLRTSLSRGRAVDIAADLQRTRDLLAASVLKCAFSGDTDRFAVTVLPASEFDDIAARPNVIGEYSRLPVSWLPDYEGQIILPDDLRRLAVQVYQHELVHHLVSACMPQAPMWLNEGLATLLETAFVEDGILNIGLPRFVIVKDPRPPTNGFYRGVAIMSVWRDYLRPVDTLVHMSPKKFYSVESNISAVQYNYASAWALVNFLELGAPDLHARFAAFLGALTGDKEVDAAALFAAHLGGAELQARLDRYLSAGSFPIVKLPAVAPRRSAPVVRPLSAGEAHLHWAWLWSKAPDGAEASAHVQEHLAAARQDPAAAGAAHLLAAVLAKTNGDEDGAEREVEKGLVASPDHPGLLQAAVELKLFRGQDPSAPAARLRPLAKTADQMCAVAGATLVAGDAPAAAALAHRALAMKRTASLCRKVLEHISGNSSSQSADSMQQDGS
jgi:hypothetical protein